MGGRRSLILTRVLDSTLTIEALLVYLALAESDAPSGPGGSRWRLPGLHPRYSLRSAVSGSTRVALTALRIEL